MSIAILLVGLLWGAYLSLMLRKATGDDMILTTVSFSAYLTLCVMAVLQRKERKSLVIYSAGLLVLCFAGTVLTIFFVAATEGLEGPGYVAAMRTFRFLGEMLCLVQWICVAISVMLDRWLVPRRT